MNFYIFFEDGIGYAAGYGGRYPRVYLHTKEMNHLPTSFEEGGATIHRILSSSKKMMEVHTNENVFVSVVEGGSSKDPRRETSNSGLSTANSGM
jgi:hypothetical protein